MDRRLLPLVALALALVMLGACGGGADDARPADSSSASTTLVPTTTLLAGAQDATVCELPEQAWVGVGVGFPRSPDRLASTGTVRVAVLFADFPDVAAGMTPEEAFDLLDGATDFLRAVSYGRLEVELVPHLAWLRMDDPASGYADAIATFEGHKAWIEEAVAKADPEVDFAGIDEVVVVATPEAEVIEKGPTWMGGAFDGGTITADGESITNAITSGADLDDWGELWLPHEMGHSLSFVDLYAFETPPDGYTRPFSLMDDIASDAPEYLAWERWHAGWIDDDQIVCLASDATPELIRIALTRVEEAGGTKAVVAPVGETRAVVVESRRAIGYDSALTTEGAVVYTVDTSIESGSGPVEVANDRQALGPGESVTVDGVTVTVIDATESGDTVEVSMAQ